MASTYYEHEIHITLLKQQVQGLQLKFDHNMIVIASFYLKQYYW